MKLSHARGIATPPTGGFARTSSATSGAMTPAEVEVACRPKHQAGRRAAGVPRRAMGKNISRSKQVTDWVAALPCGSGHTCTCNLVLVGMGADISALAGAGGRRDGCAHGCCSRGSGGVAQTTAAMVLAKHGGNSGSGEAADLWSRRGWQRGQWVHGAVGWLRSPMLMPRGRRWGDEDAGSGGAGSDIRARGRAWVWNDAIHVLVFSS